MVLPTNLKPRLLRSLLMASDSRRSRGNLLHETPRRSERGLPPTNCQMYAVERSELFLRAEESPARSVTAALTFSRLRTIPGSPSRAAIFASSVGSDAAGIETVEGVPVVLALVENRLPTQSRLRAFKDQHLEQLEYRRDAGTPHSSS